MTDAFLGVLIGASTTLAGAFVQLWFGKRQRERDRYMQLRRDVYLSAADGLAASVEYLNQHARTDIPFGKAAAPAGMVGWLFKTYLIADTDALIAFNEASTLVAAAIIDMAPHRLAVQQIEDEIAIAKTGIESTQRFLDEMRSEIKNVDVEHPTEARLRRVEWAAAQHDTATEQLHSQLRQLETLSDEHARRIKQLIEQSMVINRDLHKPVREALLAARSELDVRMDKRKFAAAAAVWDTKMSAKVAQLIALIDEQVAPLPPNLLKRENVDASEDRPMEL